VPASSIIRLVAEEHLNIGLALAPPSNNAVQVFSRKRHPLYVIARRDHPLARREVIPNLRSLLDYPLSMVPEEFGIGQLTKSAEPQTQVSLTRMMVTNSLEALKHFACSGLGLTLLPKILVARELKSGRLTAIRIRDVSLESAEAQLPPPRGRSDRQPRMRFSAGLPHSIGFSDACQRLAPTFLARKINRSPRSPRAQ
jgi:DNA-binding transcriptional LysR family regulator